MKPTGKSKVWLLQELLNQVEKWRADNQSVVFTNGCFDLLHPGHLFLLQEAARLGDRLIVAVNADVSVKQLKGNDRPVQSEQHRAALLAALEMVDAVVIFDEQTPVKLIEALSPDVLVKGGDYRPDQIAGAKWVEDRGGKVVIIPMLSGHSTTGTLQRIKP